MASSTASSAEACLRDLARGVSELTYNEVAGLLSRLLEKITSNPGEVKFRKVSLTFPLIQKTIGALILYMCT
jgi:hypothetical protein